MKQKLDFKILLQFFAKLSILFFEIPHRLILFINFLEKIRKFSFAGNLISEYAPECILMNSQVLKII